MQSEKCKMQSWFSIITEILLKEATVELIKRKLLTTEELLKRVDEWVK